MRRNCSLGWFLLAVVLGAGWAPPQKTDRPGDLTLKEKGLTRSGTVYTIEDEKPVLAKLKEVRVASASLAAMTDQLTGHQAISQQATQLEDQRAEVQSQIDDLNQRINEATSSPGNLGPPGGGGGGGPDGGGMGQFPGRTFTSPLIMERDQLKGVLSEVTAQQKTLRNQAPQAKDTSALDARVKKGEETVRSLLGELRTQVDAVTKTYADLETDAAVTKALAEARQGNARFRLGPSDSFQTGVKALVKAEQHWLGKRTTVTSKKKARAKK